MSESAGFVTIKDLTGATIATEDDDLIIQQGEETKRINLKTLGDLLVFLDKIEQVKTSTENGGINEIKATLSDGSTATFTTQNGHGIQKIEQTVKSDVSSGTNVITATLSDGQKSNFKIKNGTGFTAETTSTADENGRTSHVINFNATDTTTENKTVIVKDGIGIVPEKTNQTTSSTINGDLNEFTFTLSDGSTKTIKVYNGRGKDFRISGVYPSIAAMQADFENFALYEFAMIDTGSVEDEDTGKLFCRETEEWRYIGDLSGAQGIKGDTGVGIEKIETTESSADSGINIVKVYFTDGNTHTFQVLNGSKGLKGDTGASVIDITQTVSSTASGGKNVITFTLEDGTKRDVEVYNGAKGDSGSSNVDDIRGILPISKGGTGSSTVAGAMNNLLGAVEIIETVPDDERYYALRNMTISKDNGSFRWAKFSSLWSWIKNKIAGVLGLTATQYNGNAKTATTASSCSGNSATATNASNAYSGRVFTCSTPSGTKAKTISIPTMDNPVIGTCLTVLFTNGNSIASPTLGINGTSSDEIRVYSNGTILPLTSLRGSTSSGAYQWNNGVILDLYYNGTYWIAINNPIVEHKKTCTPGTSNGAPAYKCYLDGWKEIHGLVSIGDLKAGRKSVNQCFFPVKMSNTDYTFSVETKFAASANTTGGTEHGFFTDLNNVTIAVYCRNSDETLKGISLDWFVQGY